MKVTLAQLNPLVGDITGNLGKIKDLLALYSGWTDLIIFPELFLLGYPPRDLLEKSGVIAQTQAALQELVDLSVHYPDTGMLVGAPIPADKPFGKGLYNSAVLIYRGQVRYQHKSLLPSYDVFDETRYFEPPDQIQVFPFKDQVLGLSICEDAWFEYMVCSRRLYPIDPIKTLAEQGAGIFINISASPFFYGKEEIRYRIIKKHAEKYQRPFLYINQVGGNDELIFDGRSMLFDHTGEPVAILPAFQEAVTTLEVGQTGTPGLYIPEDKIASVHDALVLGLRDYFRKCGFSQAVIGLSGGIDSAVTCYLAGQAIGPENVLGVLMPSPYSSQGSIDDSLQLADNLGVRYQVIPITPIYQTYRQSLQEVLELSDIDITLENIQARIRGNILMAFSNRYGYIVLSTGNKSELAVGYCTLYGDMSGGLAVISDVPKTMIYELAHYINRASDIIPNEIIVKPPSAELKPDQKDQDTLPPYAILDQILHYYINEGQSLPDIMQLNYDPEIVRWVIRAVDRNEYKRRQAAPGLKVTSKAFGMGRRMPIAARYEF
jgi:NAD+ synthase (glutamine-hydrolysing)